MEIHHRLYEKTGNCGTTATGLVSAMCGAGAGVPPPGGISESSSSNLGASTSSLISASAFIPLGASTTTNELTGYSSAASDCSAVLLGPRSGPGLPSLSPATTTLATAVDLNGSHHQQQQQQQRSLSQNPGNNVCGVVGAALQSERSSTIITNSSSSSNSSSSINNNCSSCAVTTTNEPNFSQRIPKFEAEICSSCSEYILDRTLLSVNSRFWHISCLRCSQCSMLLEQYQSCFVKDDTFFCKQCYNRQFGTKCSSCRRLIQATDWVRRARNFVYHLACFACDQCKRQLSTGEEFALQNCRLLCKQHYMELVEGESGQQKAKAKRVRTTFAEEQLAVLQTHFQIDSNPDGADLERIATMTGLSKRVTQVWFQNSRARQKKYQVSKKNRIGNNNSNSGRSSTDPCSSPKSPSCDSTDGMIFPTSVLTSVEDAMVAPEQ